MLANFERFLLEMTGEEALTMSHTGDCDEDVKAHVTKPKFIRQFKKIPAADIAAELKEYGAWDANELEDEEANRKRVLWIAACDIKETMTELQRKKAAR